MSITVDAVAKASAKVNGAAVSWTHVLGSTADAIAVFFYCTNLTGTPSATVDGQNAGSARVSRTWTFAVDNHIVGFLMTGPHTGSVTVEVDITDGLSLYGGSVSLIGVHQTNPIDTTTSADDGGVGGSPATVNVTSASGELVIDGVYAKHSTGDMTAGQTQQWQFPGDGTGQETLGQQTAAGAASVTMSWTLPGLTDTWAILAMALNPATAPAPGPIPPLLGRHLEPITVHNPHGLLRM